jgi:hypothetical protein
MQFSMLLSLAGVLVELVLVQEAEVVLVDIAPLFLASLQVVVVPLKVLYL